MPSLHALVDAHEDGGVQGLCAEGGWEGAVHAIRHLDLRTVVNRSAAGQALRKD